MITVFEFINKIIGRVKNSSTINTTYEINLLNSKNILG